jgi:hypothetical protein
MIGRGYRGLRGNGKKAVVKLLLKKGAELVSKYGDGWTPLLGYRKMKSVRKGDSELLRGCRVVQVPGWPEWDLTFSLNPCIKSFPVYRFAGNKSSAIDNQDALRRYCHRLHLHYLSYFSL